MAEHTFSEHTFSVLHCSIFFSVEPVLIGSSVDTGVLEISASGSSFGSGDFGLGLRYFESRLCSAELSLDGFFFISLSFVIVDFGLLFAKTKSRVHKMFILPKKNMFEIMNATLSTGAVFEVVGFSSEVSSVASSSDEEIKVESAVQKKMLQADANCNVVPIWGCTLHHIDDLPYDPHDYFPHTYGFMRKK